MSSQNTSNKNSSETVKGIISIIFVIMLVCYFASCGSGGASSGRKWSDLSETEKANAKWAYETQQAIKNME